MKPVNTLPPLNISHERLRILVTQTISVCNESFDFNTLLGSIAKTTVETSSDFPELLTDIQFDLVLHNADKARVREIIWDFIIQRYLTIGDLDHDTWPKLSLTRLGHDYFHTKEISDH